MGGVNWGANAPINKALMETHVMAKPKTPDHPDFDDNPEWTTADFAKARPASEMLPAELARAISRRLMAGKKDATTDDFLAERRREADCRGRIDPERGSAFFSQSRRPAKDRAVVS